MEINVVESDQVNVPWRALSRFNDLNLTVTSGWPQTVWNSAVIVGDNSFIKCHISHWLFYHWDIDAFFAALGF